MAISQEQAPDLSVPGYIEGVDSTGLVYSEDFVSVLPAFADLRKQLMDESFQASSHNDYYNSRYMDLSAILEIVEPIMLENGFVMINGTPCVDGSVGVETRLWHTTGPWVANTLFMKPVKFDPQTVGKCVTYGRRYNVGALNNLRIEQDDDGNMASGVGSSSGGGRVTDMKPTEKALDFASNLASERGITIPKEATTSARACSDFIDKMKNMPKGEQRSESQSKPAGASSNNTERAQADGDEQALKAVLDYVASVETTRMLTATRQRIREHKSLSGAQKNLALKAADSRAKVLAGQ